MKRINIKLSTILLAIVAAVMFSVFFILSTDPASAENAPLTITDGASLRLENENKGLRFSATLNEQPDETAEYHMMIFPSNYLNDYVSGDYYEYITDFIAQNNQQYGTSVQLADMVCEPVLTDDINNVYEIRASLTNVLFNNSARDFTAIGYKLKDGVREYTSPVSRSLSGTAVAALQSGDYSEDAGISEIINAYVQNGIKSTLGLSESDAVPAYYVNPDTYIVRFTLADGEKEFSFNVYNTETAENIPSLNKFVYAVCTDPRITYENGKISVNGETGEGFICSVRFECPGFTHCVIFVEVISDPLAVDIFTEKYNESAAGWAPQALSNIGRSYDQEAGAIKAERKTDYSTNPNGFTSPNNRIYFRDLTALKKAYEQGYKYMSFEYYSTLAENATGSYYGFRIYSNTEYSTTACGTEIVTYTGDNLLNGEWRTVNINLETVFGNSRDAKELSFVVCGGSGSYLMLRNMQLSEQLVYTGMFDETAATSLWTGVLNCQITKSFDYTENAMKLTANGASVNNSDRHHVFVIDRAYFDEALASGYDTFTFQIKGDANTVTDSTAGFAIYSHIDCLTNGANDNRNNEGDIYSKTYAFGKTLGTELSSTEYTAVSINISDLLERAGTTGIGIWFGGVAGNSIYLKGGTFSAQQAA